MQASNFFSQQSGVSVQMQLSRSLLTYTVGPTTPSEFVLVAQLGSYTSTLLLVCRSLIGAYKWLIQCRSKSPKDGSNDDKGGGRVFLLFNGYE